MRFTKMHGTGNDYVYVNGFEFPDIVRPAELAQAVSHRHYGIGSDGLILIMPTPEADAEMVMYNADGSMSEMCGNGLRCVAKFVYDHVQRTPTLRLMTGAGMKTAEIIPGPDGTARLVRIDMGNPILQGLQIPTTWDLPKVVSQAIVAGGRTFECTCVSMGNPHCVIYVDDLKDFPVEKFGPLLENHPNFPRRVNVEFVQVISPTEVLQRTWERGAGETWACGTGACAVCVAGVLTGKSAAKTKVTLLGGDLDLDWSSGASVLMTGNAVEVYSGEFPWE